MDKELNQKINDYLHSLWEDMMDDRRELPKRFYSILHALEHLDLINSEHRELWLYRIQKCPDTDHIGGRLWCAYCGDIKRTCWECMQRNGEECGIDGHEVCPETETCGNFEYS